MAFAYCYEEEAALGVSLRSEWIVGSAARAGGAGMMLCMRIVACIEKHLVSWWCYFFFWVTSEFDVSLLTVS